MTSTNNSTPESITSEASRILDMGTGRGCLLGSGPSGSILGSGPSVSITVNKDYSPVDTSQDLDSFGFNFSSDNRKFDTGAKRDSATGKPIPDLIYAFATQRRAKVMELGATKYGIRNWEKGMPLSVFLASATRHLNQFMLGESDEDHLAHCAFNLDAIMHGQEMLRRDLWPAEYNDLPDYTVKPRDDS